jgi:hypothetical protein
MHNVTNINLCAVGSGILYVRELPELSKEMTQHWYKQMGITVFESGEELIAFKFGHTLSPKSYRSTRGAAIKLLTSEHRFVFVFAARMLARE